MTEIHREEILMICHACGDRMICPPENFEAQRTFRENHAWPCPYGSGGKPWPWDKP